MIIKKFSVIENDGKEIALPKNSKILTTNVLDNHPYLWILIDERIPVMELRTFKMFKTNEVITRYFKEYIFSFRINDTDMLHIFEV